MGQRRKHVLAAAASAQVEPPGANQHIVRALGSRGGNIVEVQYPHGGTTLCMMPARFNRKLWVRRGGYLLIDAAPEAAADGGARVTGTIAAVLYAEQVKALRKQPGVWPPEFDDVPAARPDGGPDLPEAASSSDGGEGDADEAVGDDAADEPPASSSGRDAQAAAAGGSSHAAAAAAGQAGGGEAGSGSDDDDDDDGLPPLQQINNRRVIHHYVSSDEDEDSDDDERG